MARNFVIPDLGEGVKTATIARWLVEDGARVSAGDEVLELETDKAVLPLPVEAEGYLHHGPFKSGDVVAVSTVVATIGAEGEAFAPASSDPAGQAALVTTEEPARSETASSPEPANGRSKATPLARKMAADLGVRLENVAGSGEHGKITKADVQRASMGRTEAPIPATQPPQADQAPEAAPSPLPLPSPAAVPAGVTPAEDVLQTVPLTGIRGVIARRMAQSVQTTARVTLSTEVDATGWVALREQLKAKYSEAWGFAPGYNDLLALIVASALRQFPYMNARLSADGEAIEVLQPVNLGLAVDTDRGLLVTVIREADRKGLREFGAEFRELVNRARAGKSAPEDLSGGTFTITNLGMYRVDAFTPVINLPEAAILGVGRINPKPVARGEEVVIRKMMTLSLVFDHRLVDGAPAARFLDYICEVIEDPSLLFLTRR
ncbi:MAG: dihydrolipoamide acetyltransferase family protein [Chloroflexota bacterium]